MVLFAKQKWRHSENKFMDNKGGGTNLKIGIDICTLLTLCIK